MATEILISGTVSWVVFQDRKSKRWIGICPALNLSVEEKTLGDLSETIDDALHALFLDLARAGELEEFLQEHGWQLQSSLPRRLSNVRFTMPYTTERKVGHDRTPTPA